MHFNHALIHVKNTYWHVILAHKYIQELIYKKKW